MTTFIRAAEIWLPDTDGHLLEFGSGLYDHAPAFGALSRSMCFGRGEGLPGRVWDEARPVVLADLQGGHFQRAAAARAAGLTCAVAFPVFFGALLKAVVVLFCGDGANQSGAIEVWQASAADSRLRLLDGVYGARDAAFEAVSRESSFAAGEGLPGRARERQASVFVNGLAGSPAFARGGAAAATGLRRGLAFPCPVPGAEPFVLVLLSAPPTPIATRLESWVAGDSARSLRRAYGFDERDGALPDVQVAAGGVDRALFETFATGVPTLGSAGPAPVIALPVVRDGAVVETIGLTLLAPGPPGPAAAGRTGAQSVRAPGGRLDRPRGKPRQRRGGAQDGARRHAVAPSRAPGRGFPPGPRPATRRAAAVDNRARLRSKDCRSVLDADAASVRGPLPPAAWFREWWPRARPWVLGTLSAVLAAAIAFALHRVLGQVRYASVMAAVEATSRVDIALALLATAASYLALTGYDASSLRYAGAQVGRGTVLLTSLVAYALSNTIGLGPLSGGAVRMRMYSAAGLEPGQIGRVIVFNAAAFGLGISAFGALGLLWGAAEVAPLLHTPVAALRTGAVLALVALAAFVWLCSRRRLVTIARRWTLRLPPARLALQQLVISGFELSASAAALWVLLPGSPIGLPTFVAFYAIAITAGVVSHVPGGVGVFEAVMLLSTGRAVPSNEMLGALLLYRGLYYLLPLALAAALLIVYELRSGVAAPVGRIAVHLSPRLMAALALVAGLWLLFSGVTPFTEDAREILVTLHVPLPLVEASHFLGSVAGLGLLLVARGLLHQLDAAWWAALGLSIVAAVLALPKGIALNEAAYLSTLAVLLLISRRQFDRRSSLFAQRLEPEWVLALGGVIAACVWVLFFAYQEVRYSNQLWWQFEIDAQAPRSLRALLAVALIGLAYGLWQLLRPPAGEVADVSAGEIDRAAAIVRANPSSDGCYALVGDKHLLFSPSGRSFLMFGKQGRSWVSLFGPFGDAREWPDLVWHFVEMATDHGGRAAFYQVRPASLPLFLDCGLHAFKLGEHAHVTLPDFNLKGAKRANLRSGVNRGQREGLVFDVLSSPDEVEAALPALREVSDAWLAQQRTREKRFSVGRFDADYLRRLPVAVARRDGRIIAFANLLATDAKQEASVDLMRYLPDSPPGTMDFLFAKVLLHLQAEGYQRFGLGMSPMAGMAERRRAPRWQRLGRLLFDHGERFYNFRGLHSFKDKFEPVWEARYLAAPNGLVPLFMLADVAALIGGGAKGVVAR